ncbi:TPA: phage tail protein [Klebsiella pneumoniae]|nr:phage tail protein [Klebsiella pneumoniae]HBY1349102.1 phage tail protein [Klebsiella pneumoniae]HBY1362050.1 phage tail protein [Klebsiella pneumoniae]HBY1415610.1 phage tail protein [Klebsiella pneumoniae]HBY1422263.1 phage tail protein [Klebsiella pneumoniae]
MSAKFYTLLTDIGAAKLASAAALGVPLKITQMAVGDGGGVLPTPNAQQTALVAEKRRAALNMLYIDPQNSSQIIAEQVIPETEGGWWIREVGLFDDTGALIAVGNCPESYKPQLAEGSGRTQTVRMVLITSSTDNITLKIDPAVVLATRKYVDDKVLELKVYVDELMAKHLAAADPHTQYAPKESPALTGTPKAPTAPAGTNTTQIANTAFVQAVVTALNNALALKAPLASPALTGVPTAPTAAQTVNNTQVATTAFVKSAIAALVASSPAALDTLNELAEALGNDPNFATTMTNALAGKQPLDDTLTSLSGKSISELLQYLGLGDASGYVGRLLKIQVFTASGTVTKTPGAKKWRIKCLGAGAGSSAAPATGSNEVSVSNGGGAGAYAEGIYDVSSITTASVVIGSGGAGGTAGSIYGADGGTSSVGSFISSPGGKAGLPAGPANPPFQPVANSNSDSSTGWNIVGSSGAGAEPAVAVANSYAVGSRGSNSIFGVGGSVPAINNPANPGGGYGSGASGCSNGPSQSAKSGAAGRPGIVIIEELA